MSTAPIPLPDGRRDISVDVVTPKQAGEYLARNSHNRRLRSRVVDAYAADMTAGAWRVNGETIKFDEDGALLDGQHRLAAIVKSGVAVEMIIVRDLPAIAQETMDGGAKRKFSDVLQLRGEKNYIQLAASCRIIAQWRSGRRDFSGTFTTRQMLEVLETYPWLREGATITSRVATHSGIPSSVLGLCWWLFVLIDPDDCSFFFDRLASDQDHHAGDPIYELRRVADAARSVRGERSTKYLTAVTIKAWNKFRDGESLSQLRFRPGGANPEKFPEPR